MGSDLHFILVDKANVGSYTLHRTHTKPSTTGRAMMYAEIYKWFSDTSVLGLMERAANPGRPFAN